MFPQTLSLLNEYSALKPFFEGRKAEVGEWVVRDRAYYLVPDRLSPLPGSKSVPMSGPPVIEIWERLRRGRIRQHVLQHTTWRCVLSCFLFEWLSMPRSRLRL
jgi:hypothetical protein